MIEWQTERCTVWLDALMDFFDAHRCFSDSRQLQRWKGNYALLERQLIVWEHRSFSVFYADAHPVTVLLYYFINQIESENMFSNK